jgi:hypothetical protein
VRSLVGATIELNRDDEYPTKPGFFGCGMNTVALGKRQNFEFLQPPHSQRDPPGFLGEDDWEARAGLILFSALTLTLAPAQTTAVRPALLAKNLFASPWVRRAALSRASQAVVGCQRRGSLLNLLVRSLVGGQRLNQIGMTTSILESRGFLVRHEHCRERKNVKSLNFYNLLTPSEILQVFMGRAIGRRERG